MSLQYVIVGKHFRSEPANIIMDPASIAEVFSLDCKIAIYESNHQNVQNLNVPIKVGLVSATDGSKVTFAQLWANQTCVIVFLRFAKFSNQQLLSRFTFSSSAR